MKQLLLIAILAVAMPAWSWKIDTHIWLADQLYDEIKATGNVRIGRLGTLPVPPRVRDSIVANRGAFLLGVLGPDIYPDMVAGQMTTHPGLPPNFEQGDLPTIVNGTLTLLNRPFEASPGWQTDDWLRFVRDRAFAESGRGAPTPDIALAYGYMIHAAMDTWAHTYVNLYAGDTFEILSNQEVSARHVAIESFFKNVHQSFLPKPAATRKSTDARGRLARTVARPGTLVQKPDADALSDLHGPAHFVRRNLILHPAAAGQYARSEATLHVWAMHIYWSEVDRLAQRLQPLKAAANNAFNAADNAVDNAQVAFDAAQQAYDFAVDAAAEAYDAFQDAEAAALDAADAFNDTKNELFGAVTAVTDQLLAGAPPWMRNAYNQAKQAVNDANDALDDARENYEALRDARDDQEAALNAAAQQLNLKQQTKGALQITRQQMLPAIDGAVVQWRGRIEAAIDAYVRAWEETAKEIMRPHGARFTPGSDATGPLKQWVACWGPTFGLSPPVVAANCEAGLTQYGNARSRLNQMLTNAILPANVRDAVEAFDHRVQLIGADLLVKVTSMISSTIRIDNGVLAGSAAFAVQLWDKEVTLADLKNEFANDTSGKQLFVYQGDQSVEQLIAADMGVPATSRGLTLAELSNFAALQNSMTMARLTLLDGTMLNRLATKQGIRRTVYSSPPRGARLAPGQPLYPSKAPAGEFLIGALRSIDGNHQWQERSPKLPRNPRSAPQPSATCLRYGYPLVNYASRCEQDRFRPAGKGGLRLWQDRDVREAVFKTAFQGPVAPALCQYIGRDKLPAGIGCADDPFPSVVDEPDRRQSLPGRRLAPRRR